MNPFRPDCCRKKTKQNNKSCWDFAHLSGRACQHGPSSLSWNAQFAPDPLASQYPGRWCHWGSAQSSLQLRQVSPGQDSPVLVCAVLNCTVSLCCMKGCTLIRSWKWTCSAMGCNVSCCTVSGCTWLLRYTWTCSASAYNVRVCNRLACGMLGCTVTCVCTLTLVNGSCTSSLQWSCGCASPFAVSPGGEGWEIQENAPVQ